MRKKLGDEFNDVIPKQMLEKHAALPERATVTQMPPAAATQMLPSTATQLPPAAATQMPPSAATQLPPVVNPNRHIEDKLDQVLAKVDKIYKRQTQLQNLVMAQGAELVAVREESKKILETFQSNSEKVVDVADEITKMNKNIETLQKNQVRNEADKSMFDDMLDYFQADPAQPLGDDASSSVAVCQASSQATTVQSNHTAANQESSSQMVFNSTPPPTLNIPTYRPQPASFTHSYPVPQPPPTTAGFLLLCSVDEYTRKYYQAQDAPTLAKFLIGSALFTECELLQGSVRGFRAEKTTAPVYLDSIRMGFIRHVVKTRFPASSWSSFEAQLNDYCRNKRTAIRKKVSKNIELWTVYLWQWLQSGIFIKHRIMFSLIFIQKLGEGGAVLATA